MSNCLRETEKKVKEVYCSIIVLSKTGNDLTIHRKMTMTEFCASVHWFDIIIEVCISGSAIMLNYLK